MTRDDEERFADLYRQHLPMVRRVAADGVRRDDRGLVEDFAQVVFLRLWSYLAAGNPVDRPAALLGTITRHTLIDYYRVKRNTSTVAVDFTDSFEAFRLPVAPGAEDVAVARMEACELFAGDLGGGDVFERVLCLAVAR
ncbi:MAG TPA: sigma-70 family RNA polymerase sigma factor [Actinocrinis sp.]|nr:sigma-70 family RNA polymerase sigma factor [Actinocrinis sp.]